MKKLIRRFSILLIALSVAIIGLIYSISPSASAGTTSPYTTTIFEVYDYDDYIMLTDFEGQYGVEYEVMKAEIQAYDDIVAGDYSKDLAWDIGGDTYEDLDFYDEDAGIDPDTWWNGGYILSNKNASNNQSNYRYALSGTANNVAVKSGTVTAAGHTITEAREIVEKYESIAPLSDVKNGKKVVVVVKAAVDSAGGLCAIQVAMSDNIGGVLTATSGSWVNSEFTTSANGTVYTGGRYIGGTPDLMDNTHKITTDSSGYAYVGALAYDVTGSGSFTLAPDLNSGFCSFTVVGGTSFSAPGDSAHFNVPTNTMTAKGDKSDDPSLAKIAVTAGTTTTNITSIPATTDDYASPINVSMTSGKPKATDTTATVTVTAKDNATVTSMKYRVGTSGSWTTMTNGGSVNLGDPGQSTYVEVVMTAEDTTTTATYILEIPKEKYQDCELISTGTISTDGTGTPSLDHTFTSADTAYTLTVPNDATNITLAPTFDYQTIALGGKEMTADFTNVGGSTGTAFNSGSTITITPSGSKFAASGTSFKVTVYAQDTSKSIDYIFNIVTAEIDNTLNVSVDNKAVSPNKNYPGSFSSTTWGLTKAIEPSVASVTVTLSNAKKGTITYTYNGTTFNPSTPVSSTSLTVNFNGTGADTQTINVDVKSQSGDIESYVINVDRRDKNTCTDLDLVNTKILDNNGTTINGTWDPTTKTFTTSSDIDFTKTGFKVVPVLSNDCKEDNVFVSTMTYSTGTTPATILSGGTTSTVSFSGYAQDTKTITITVTAEDASSSTYTINVTRERADTDATLKDANSDTIPDINVVDSNSNNVSFNYDPTTKTFTTTNKLDADIDKVTLNMASTTSTTSKLEVGNTQSSYSAFSGSFTRNLTLSTTDQTTNFYVRVTAENPTHQNVYTFVINSEAQQDNNNFTGTVVSLGNNAVCGESADKSTAVDHVYFIDKTSGGTTFKLTINLAADSDKAKIYWSTNPTTQTTLLPDGGTITDSIGAYGSPTKIYVKIVSQHGTPSVHVYEIQHTDTRDSNSKISDIVIEGEDYKGNVVTFTSDYLFNQNDTTTKTINVKYEVTKLKFIVTLEKDTSKLKYNSGTSLISPGTGTSVVNIPLFNTPNSQLFTFQGYAENDTLNVNIYKIQIERETPETGNVITSLKLNSSTVTGYAPSKDVAYNIGLNTNSVTVDLEVSPKALFTYSYDSIVEKSSPINMTNQFINGSYKKVVINVKSQKEEVDGGAGNTYTIYMLSADDSTKIDNINVYESSLARPLLEDVNSATFVYVDGTNNYLTPEFNIAYLKNNPEFEVELNASHPNVSVTGDGIQNQPVGSKIHNIVVKSEYNSMLETLGLSSLTVAAQTVTYKIAIKREAASTDNTLDWLDITIDGNVYHIDLTKTDKIENVGNVGSITVDYEKTNKLSTISSPASSTTKDKSGVKVGKFSYPINLSDSNKSTTFSITVKAEDPTIADTEYRVGIFAGAATQSKNKDITNIKITGDKTTANIMTGKNTYNQTKLTYDPTISGVNEKAYINVVLPEAKVQILKINGVTHDPSSDKEIELGTYGSVTTVEIQCTAEDGTPGDTYTIDITREALDGDIKLKSFKIETYKEDGSTTQAVPGFSATDEGGTYTVNVKNDIAKIKLVPDLNSSKSTIVSNSAQTETAIVVGANGPFTVSVKAENEATELYLVNVYRDDVTTLEDLILVDQDGNAIDGYTFNKTLDPQNYTINVKYAVEKINVTAVPEGDRANLTITGEGNHNIAVGSNPTIKVVVTAKSGASTTYTLNVTRADGVADNKIVSYINQEGVDQTAFASANKIEYNLARNTTSWAPTIEYPEGSTNNYDEIDKTLVPGLNKKTLIITSETGVSRTYEISVYCTETTRDLKELNLLKSAGSTPIMDLDNSKYIRLTPLVMDIEIPYGDTPTLYGYLEAIIGDSSAHAKVYIDGVEASSKTVEIMVGLNTYNVAVLSEDDIAHGYTYADAQVAYNVNVTRNTPNSDAHLEELKLFVGGVERTLTPVFSKTHDGGVYIVENIGDTVTFVKITAKAIESTTKINGGTYLVSNTPGTYTRNLSLESLVSATEGYTKDFEIVTLAEDGQTTYTYTITVSRGPLNLDEDYQVKYVILEDSENTLHIDENYTWESKDYKATATVPYSAQSITITVGKTQVSPSVVHFTKGGTEINNPLNRAFYTDTITSSMRGSTVTYTVYVESQSKANQSEEYTITITFEDASADRFLSQLYADDVLVTGFDPNDTSRTSYTYNLAMRDYNTNTINIRAVLSDSKASLVGSDLGDMPLEVGDNQFTVIVTAENKEITKYIINVRRDELAPYITDLAIEGKSLLDLNNKATTFTNDVKAYHGKVTYFEMTATIKVTIDNPSYTVTCSNATSGSSTRLLKTFETSTLAVGANEFKISVISPVYGKTTTYTLTIIKSDQQSANTAITNIVAKKVDEAKKETQLTQAEFEFNDDKQLYSGIVVDNDIKDIIFDVTLENGASETGDGATIKPYNNKDLRVGLNTIFLVVTAEDGVTKRIVEIEVTRLAPAYEIGIQEITPYKDDYKNDTLKSSYTVPSNVSDLTFDIKATSTTADDFTYTIVNGNNLAVGENTVKVEITASDGKKEVQEIKVIRENMKFKVDKAAYEYECNEAVNAAQINTATDLYYTINLGDKKADVITDYAKYITEMSDGVTAKTISNPDNNASEVIVKVANSDETEVAYVHFQIQTTANRGSLFDWLFWIILGVSIIILIIILICVNRDKYGSVSKKRKKAQ